MKIQVSYQPSFSAELLRWSATLIVGSRGSFSCRWMDASGEVSKKRCRFGLTIDELLDVEGRLARLPSPLTDVVVDGTAIKTLVVDRGSTRLERSRFVWNTELDAAEVAFEALWHEMQFKVNSVLAEMDVEPRVLAKLENSDV